MNGSLTINTRRDKYHNVHGNNNRTGARKILLKGMTNNVNIPGIEQEIHFSFAFQINNNTYI